MVVVEIVSPGSRRTDRVANRSEYADAGIPHYWIADLDGWCRYSPAISLRASATRMAAASPVFFITSEPFLVRLNLDQLL